MKRLPPFRLNLLLSLLPLCGLVHAEAERNQLPVVKVSARTSTQDDTVNRAQLEQRQARDLSDIYRADAEISVGGGGSAFAQKVYIRGMEESMLSLSIDGAQQNGKVYHHQTALVIDPQLIRAIEVEKGTAAASAGPGALGGAIRLYTVDATDLLRPGQSWGASGSAGAFSNKGWRGSLNAYGQTEELDLLVAASRVTTEDYRDGQGQTVADSASKREHYLAKLGLALGADRRLVASWQRSVDDGVRNARANMVGFAHPVVPNDPIPQQLARDTASLRYEAGDWLGLGALEAQLYRTEVATDRTTKAGRNYGERLDTQGFDLGLKRALGRHELKYGLNWRSDASAALKIQNRFNNTGSGRERSRVAGAYVEGSLDLGRVDVSAGVRYDDYGYSDNHGQQFASRGLSPSASLRWQVLDGLLLKAGHARALRGVGLKEAFMLDIAQWKNVAEIDPERASNSEIGFEFGAAGLLLSGNVYRQKIENFITSLACELRVGCRDNAGTARVDGYELALSYRRGDWSGRMAVAEARPELAGRALGDGDLGLGVSTGRTWTAALSYRLPKLGLELGWQGRKVESLRYQPVGSVDPASKPGHAVHDLQLGWLPLEDDRLRVNFAVRNLFDKQYFDQATYAYNGWQGKVLGYAEPGRDLRIELNWRY
ncbi:TonB-dependent receptor domain-containing protein [Paucibacter sp. XJ19-41]|uniref:TonB-dependent receptor domain-containing protein n=1 Tax=Paucibacter sp. XJ19-41 TaxID=2927824 RepID=UPI002349CAA8|nr:TonB-dependent receptor [Paucibacter sp. XJ19-41]MDC6166799.1 TonB-dependent receptor [Paucibacter sp. XJ19-41]